MVLEYRGHDTKDYLEWYGSKPQEILIETVGPCNLRCLGCPQSLEDYRDKKWKPAFMDFDLFISILDQVRNLWEPINVGLYHTGEITLMPDEMFDRFLTASKTYLPTAKGWDSVGFYTNGLLLTEAKRKSIIKNGINWVRLSFDGGDKESYESVRVGSNFETVYANARALASEAADASHQMRLEVIFVPYTENELKIAQYHDLWWHTGWKSYTGGTMNYGGLMTEQVNKRRHRYQGQRRPRHSVPCPRIFEQFSVLVDGRVSACSADPMGIHVLGDLTKESVKDVWEGKRRSSRGIIAAHTQGKASQIEPCASCDYTEFCSVPAGEFFGENNE